MQLVGDRCLTHELICGLYPRINMNYNPEKHHRRSIRLKGYDYRREGGYYFTICCHKRRCLLGEIEDGVMHLNLVGATVKAVWDSLSRHFPLIELDAFVVMPNHVHGIIVITDSSGNSNPNCNNNRNPKCRGEAFVPVYNSTPPESLSTNASPFPGCNNISC
jgi:putative transposase